MSVLAASTLIVTETGHMRVFQYGQLIGEGHAGTPDSGKRKRLFIARSKPSTLVVAQDMETSCVAIHLQNIGLSMCGINNSLKEAIVFKHQTEPCLHVVRVIEHGLRPLPGVTLHVCRCTASQNIRSSATAFDKVNFWACQVLRSSAAGSSIIFLAIVMRSGAACSR